MKDKTLAKQYERQAIDLVVTGEFDAAFDHWKKSNVCNDICTDIVKSEACCARCLEGRLLYLALVKRDESYTGHAIKLRKWIETSIED